MRSIRLIGLHRVESSRAHCSHLVNAGRMLGAASDQTAVRRVDECTERDAVDAATRRGRHAFSTYCTRLPTCDFANSANLPTRSKPRIRPQPFTSLWISR